MVSAFQTGGRSNSRAVAVKWSTFEVAKIERLEVSEQTFAPQPSFVPGGTHGIATYHCEVRVPSRRQRP